jgi:hypothetical protein
MKAEAKPFRLFYLSIGHLAGPTGQSVLLAKAAFKSLKNNIGNHHHHHAAHIRSAIYHTASRKLIIHCSAVWLPKLVIFKSQLKASEARGFRFSFGYTVSEEKNGFTCLND